MSSRVSLYHQFSANIIEILRGYFGEYVEDIFDTSPLIGYLNHKTKSANLGSKSRSSYANHYALYVVIEDYIIKGFADGSAGYSYAKYEGTRFSDLFRRQRELPFGTKLQNHGLNSRLNDEFRKYYPALNMYPIIRDLEKQRYWIQDDLLQVQIRNKNGEDAIFNIAHAVIDIIDAYVAIKKAAFESFIDTCHQIAIIGNSNSEQANGTHSVPYRATGLQCSGCSWIRYAQRTLQGYSLNN